MLRTLLSACAISATLGHHRRGSSYCRYFAETAAEKERCCWKYGIGCDDVSYDCSTSQLHQAGTEHVEYCCIEEYTGCEYTKYDICFNSDFLTSEQQQYCCRDLNIGCSTDVFDCDLSTQSTWTTLQGVYCCGLGIGCPADCTASLSTWSNVESDLCCTVVNSIGYYYTESQRDWCCEERNIGCDERYDCFNEVTTWSDDQRDWCCREKLICTSNDVCYQATATDHDRDYCCKWRNIGCSYDCSGSTRYWDSNQVNWCCKEKNVCGQDYSCTPSTALRTADESSFCCSTKSVGCTDFCYNSTAVLSSNQKAWCCSVAGVLCGGTDINCLVPLSDLSTGDQSWCCLNRNIGCTVVEVALTVDIVGSDYLTAKENPRTFVTNTRQYLLQMSKLSGTVDVVITKVKSTESSDHFIVPKEWNTNTTQRTASTQQSNSVGVDYLLIGPVTDVHNAAQNIKAVVTPQESQTTIIIVHADVVINDVGSDDDEDIWFVVVFVAVGVCVLVSIGFGCLYWHRQKRDKKLERRRGSSNNNNNNNNNNSNNNANNRASREAARQRSPSPPPPPPVTSNEPDKDEGDAIEVI